VSKKKAANNHRSKKEVTRVEGNRPLNMSLDEQLAMRAKIERYITVDLALTALLRASLITRSEYGRLEERNCERSGLSKKSIYRTRVDS